MASPMQWRWTWAKFGRWWGTEGLVCCSPCSRKELNTTGRLNNNDRICITYIKLGLRTINCIVKKNYIFSYNLALTIFWPAITYWTIMFTELATVVNILLYFVWKIFPFRISTDCGHIIWKHLPYFNKTSETIYSSK